MFIIPAPNEIAFKIFNFPVYWYGITMASGILAGIIVSNYLFNKINFPKHDTILEYAPLIILFGILGARIYFCCLSPAYYFSHPLEILDIRQGGLSIHGGILGGLLSIIFVSYRTKVPFLGIIDALSCGTILGQAIGRWGNYFNSEAYGIPVASQNWGLFVPFDKRVEEFAQYSLFHPTFLYESLLDLTAFFVLVWIYKKFGAKHCGLTFFAYLVIYSIIRFFIESLRLDSALNVGTIPIAQIVSILLFLIGILGGIIIFKRKSH